MPLEEASSRIVSKSKEAVSSDMSFGANALKPPPQERQGKEKRCEAREERGEKGEEG